MGSNAVLEVQGLTVFHGQLRALDHVSLRVDTGEVYAMIGANGAGKSTLLRTIAGLHRPTEGAVVLDGAFVTHMSPERRLAAGIALVPEGRRLFPSLTVEENLLVGSYHGRPGPWDLERVYRLFAWMRERAHQRTEHLSGGEQQAVAIGRALVANPRVLLLDEVAGGLTDPEVVELVDVVRLARDAGTAVIWIEHVVRALVETVDRLICLAGGRFIGDGPPSDVLASPAVREVFLGTEATAETLAEAGRAAERAAEPTDSGSDPPG